jgi:CDP-diacylglycerol--serine O-phosphatidyltransferase
VMIFALASALRLARFNAALDDEKPKWQSNYFMGMPTPAAAIVLLLPVYLDQLGLADIKSQWALKIVLVYTVFIAFMMVSSIPTYSGKLVGERVGREWVLPIFVVAIGVVAFLFTYPYETLTVLTLIYLGFIPVSWRNFRDRSEGESAAAAAQATSPQPGETPKPEQGTGRIFTFRPTDPTK